MISVSVDMYDDDACLISIDLLYVQVEDPNAWLKALQECSV